MIAKTYILENLSQLDRAFQKAKTQKLMVYFSKLAILELCGWIEVSMDDIVMTHCGRKIAGPNNIKYFENDIVKKSYGFDYERNFRKMLINLVGIVGCERLEQQIPISVHTKLLAQLNTLKISRNSHAHTYLKGPAVTFRIDAPSITKARFPDIYDGLKAFENGLRLI